MQPGSGSMAAAHLSGGGVCAVKGFLSALGSVGLSLEFSFGNPENNSATMGPNENLFPQGWFLWPFVVNAHN